MLILTRRPGESVLIDNPIAGAEPITVTVLGIKGNQVRIGIAAPTDVTILREELISVKFLACWSPPARRPGNG